MRTDIIKTAYNITSPITSALATIDSRFLAIPIISSVVTEVCDYFDDKTIERRLEKLEKEAKDSKFDMASIQKAISEMNEHNFYVMRNNLKAFLVSAYPEITDAYAKCIISYLRGKDQNLDEEICEILQACNANDIHLLEMIKGFINSDCKEVYKASIESTKEKNTKLNNGQIKYRDRSNYFNQYTIFWKDFMKYCNVDGVNDMSIMLNIQLQANGEELVYDWAYYSRSMIKLQNMGVFQLDFLSTLGTVSQFNVERFHVTLFGQKLLQYL